MSTSLPTSQQTIFIVDDEPVIARTLAVILCHSGFHAVPFTHAADAIAAALQNEPDLLLSDVMMPKITGVQLAIHFKRTHPRCRILLFSGQAGTVDLLDEARASGFDLDLLEKPIHPNDLIARIRK